MRLSASIVIGLQFIQEERVAHETGVNLLEVLTALEGVQVLVDVLLFQEVVSEREHYFVAFPHLQVVLVEGLFGPQLHHSTAQPENRRHYVHRVYAVVIDLL